MTAQHTPEPWVARQGSELWKGQQHLASFWLGRVMHANAARTVACVNALTGLNPEAVADVVAALIRLRPSVAPGPLGLALEQARQALAKLEAP